MRLFKRFKIKASRFLLSEFCLFALKEAQACIFAGAFFLLLLLSKIIPVHDLIGLYRYDFLFIAAVLIQIFLYLFRLETKDEIKVICLFHVIGLVLELYKTHPSINSWSYPEEGYLKIGTVPLYSGFMYAAVGSYICQAWKILKLELSDYKHYKKSIFLGILIYLNFFTNHFVYDFRLFLILGIFLLFWQTKVFFIISEKKYSMPLVLSFILIAFFIWLAENMATYLGAWKYAYQLSNWHVVSFHKISSWFLLVIISFMIVANLKHFKENISLSSTPIPKE